MITGQSTREYVSDSDDGPINTRPLMAASALYTALVGLSAALFEEELLAYFGASTAGFGVVLAGVAAGINALFAASFGYVVFGQRGSCG